MRLYAELGLSLGEKRRHDGGQRSHYNVPFPSSLGVMATVALSSAVNEFRLSVVALQGFAGLFDTDRDTPDMRRRCKESRRKAAEQARAVKRELDALMRDRMTPIVQEKVMKLKKQFQKLVAQYKKVNESAMAKTKAVMKNQKSWQSGSGDASFGAEQGQAQALASGDIQFTAIEVDVDLELLRERQKDYEDIERDTVELQQLVNEVDGLVTEQGIELEVIETHVTKAQGRVARGAENLGDAREYQRLYRQKLIGAGLCCLLIVGATIGGVVLSE